MDQPNNTWNDEQLCRMLLENMSTAFAYHQMILDEKGEPMDYRFIKVNPMFEQLTGLRAEDIENRCALELLPSLDSFWINTYGGVALGGDPIDIERYDENFGKHFRVRAYSPARGFFAVTFFDITAEVEREEALSQNLEEQKKLREELELERQRLQQEVKHRTEEVQHLNEELSANNEELISSNEELSSLNEHLNVQKQELERVINELKVAQEQLVQSEKMASVGVLTSGIAHEINNPINFISSGVVGLEMEVNDVISAVREYELYYNQQSVHLDDHILEQIEQKYHFRKAMDNIPKLIESIQTGVVRTVKIIKGLRTFARMDSEVKTTANLNELIQAALTILYNRYKLRVTVKTNLCEQAEITCYPGKLSQVFLNIIMNSIDAIEGEGVIKISSEFNTNQKLYCITIEDSGSGIPVEIQQRIFDPFFTTKPVGQGIGMGLSIVHGIITDHNGQIHLDSAQGKGSKFTIILPK